MTISVRGGTSGDVVPPNSTTPIQQGSQSSEASQQQPDNKNSAVQSDDSASLLLPNGEVAFPLSELSKLDEMINRPRWVVPVLPKGELEVLLEASIKLCRAGKGNLFTLMLRLYSDRNDTEISGRSWRQPPTPITEKFKPKQLKIFH